jgi:hypothetical protein
MLWDFTLDWYNRVYSCTKITGAGATSGADTYKCKRFHSVEAANMYRSYMRLNDVPLLYMCRFTPLVMDSTILKFKLKENVVLY